MNGNTKHHDKNAVIKVLNAAVDALAALQPAIRERHFVAGIGHHGVDDLYMMIIRAESALMMLRRQASVTADEMTLSP